MKTRTRETKKFADGEWPKGLRRRRAMVEKFADLARELVRKVKNGGVFKRSEARNRREEQVLLRLAILGYLKVDTLRKNVDERIFWPVPQLPIDNFLGL